MFDIAVTRSLCCDVLDITLTKVITDDGNFLPSLIFKIHFCKYKKNCLKMVIIILH